MKTSSISFQQEWRSDWKLAIYNDFSRMNLIQITTDFWTIINQLYRNAKYLIRGFNTQCKQICPSKLKVDRSKTRQRLFNCCSSSKYRIRRIPPPRSHQISRFLKTSPCLTVEVIPRSVGPFSDVHESSATKLLFFPRSILPRRSSRVNTSCSIFSLSDNVPFQVSNFPIYYNFRVSVFVF